jgi:hypothetical protein
MSIRKAIFAVAGVAGVALAISISVGFLVATTCQPLQPAPGDLSQVLELG